MLQAKSLWRMSASKVCAASLLGLLAAFPAAAQEHDDVIIFDEEQPTSAQSEVMDFIDRYVYGSAGGLGFFGSGGATRFWGGEIGIDYTRDIQNIRVRGVLEAGYGARYAEITQEREEAPAGDEDGTERDIEIESNNFELRQAYVEIEPLPQLVITAGRFSPIWGQFDVTSPVNLLLPIEVQSNNFGIGKDNYRMPQDSVVARWFPNERLEVQGWYFPFIRLDPLVEEVLYGSDCDADLEDCEDHAAMRNRVKDRIGDYDAFALRALYYGDAFTLGVTYLQGHQHLSFFERKTLITTKDDDGNYVMNAGPDEECIGVILCENSRGPDLPEMTAFGFELSVPHGNWIWRAEAVYFESALELLCCNYEPSASPRHAAQTLYYDWITERNDGRLNVDTPQLFAAAGFDAVYDDWAFGVAVFLTTPLLSSESQEARDLEADAFPDDDSQLELSGVFPNLYVIYSLDEEDQHTIGAAAGFLGPAAGLTLFYSGNWQDSWNWWVSADYLTLLSSQLANDSNSETLENSRQEWELKDDFTVGVRAGLVYSF